MHKLAEHPAVLISILFVVHFSVCSSGESTTCLTVYKEGGAPAVFRSPKCPGWKIPYHHPASSPRRCDLSVVKGRRKSQEDRTVCVLDIPIPFPGKSGVEEVIVGIVAVFDGHNGVEASEMASSLFLEYFAVHTYFLLDAAFSFVSKKHGGKLFERDEKDVSKFFSWNKDIDLGSQRWKFPIPQKFDKQFPLEVLKEALLRTIHDIDATFTKEAIRNNIDAGTTATIVLMADGHILVANVGDSKAILCSEKFLPSSDAKATLLRLYSKLKRNGDILRKTDFRTMKSASSKGITHLVVEELTSDHHLDRDDERSRVEAAGGFVVDWGGLPRVNGELAVSRAIGDVKFKRYGVIPTPELLGWKLLDGNESYLVVASDGIFEKLSVQDVCDVLAGDMLSADSADTYPSCSSSVAECLANTAYDMGTMDNAAAVVVPLKNFGSLSHPVVDQNAVVKEDYAFSYESHPRSAINQIGTSYPDQITWLLSRMLVKKENGVSGCYYLSDHLNEKVGLMPPANNQNMTSECLMTPVLDSYSYHSSGSLNLYSDLNVCLFYELIGGKLEDQCFQSEGFSSLLGLLESVPFHQTGSDHGSTEYDIHQFRYKLEKRCGRGSYGEVWLAVLWNCHQNSNLFEYGTFGTFDSFNASYSNSTTKSSFASTKQGRNHTGYDGNLFILKRILVEKGTSFYLSGLREKHFGEIFLNASRCIDFLGSPFKLNDVDLEFCSESDVSNTDDLFGSWNMKGTRTEEGLNHIARYVESFESKTNDVWLVFRHEGISLSKLIYSEEEIIDEFHQKSDHGSTSFKVLHPSKYWHWLRTTEAGKEEMRNLMWQLLSALKSCHNRNITHRDIKPENLVVCFEDQYTGKCLSEIPIMSKNYTLKMRIIDFGSALNEFTLKHLYGSAGPSSGEQTSEYSPPEAFLNSSWHLDARRRKMFDTWSVGVVFLELILGSPNVFQISARTRSLLDPHIVGWTDHLKELVYKLRSFMELCILNPSIHYHSSAQDENSPASWKCSEEFFSHQIKIKDPLNIGFPNILALRLVRQLLVWDPDDRLSVEDALNHPYFQPPPKG